MMSPNPLRTANLRAPYSQARCSCRRVADGRHGGGRRIDPVEFRLRHLTGNNNERVAAVLRAGADKAAWRRVGTARPGRRARESRKGVGWPSPASPGPSSHKWRTSRWSARPAR